jgi:hypothetical protein
MIFSNDDTVRAFQAELHFQQQRDPAVSVDVLLDALRAKLSRLHQQTRLTDLHASDLRQVTRFLPSSNAMNFALVNKMVKATNSADNTRRKSVVQKLMMYAPAVRADNHVGLMRKYQRELQLLGTPFLPFQDHQYLNGTVVFRELGKSITKVIWDHMYDAKQGDAWVEMMGFTPLGKLKNYRELQFVLRHENIIARLGEIVNGDNGDQTGPHEAYGWPNLALALIHLATQFPDEGMKALAQNAILCLLDRVELDAESESESFRWTNHLGLLVDSPLWQQDRFREAFVRRVSAEIHNNPSFLGETGDNIRTAYDALTKNASTKKRTRNNAANSLSQLAPTPTRRPRPA